MDWQDITRTIDKPIIKLGEAQLSIISIITLLVFVAVLVILISQIRSRVLQRMLMRSPLDASGRLLVGTSFQYGAVLIGLLIILQTAGIDLTTLTVLAGALGVGIGLGLQSIASNFVSGFVILLERPIRIGDRIEIDDVNGEVMEVRARSTTVMTNDGIAIIVPNSKFVTENVINWSYGDPRVRFRVPVVVDYDADVGKVQKLLLEVAAEDKDVLEAPAPAVWLMRFGQSGVEFELLVWTVNMVHRRGRMISTLNYAIYDKLTRNGVRIAVPQRDVRFREGTGAPPKQDDNARRESGT